jgi:hypothetical protein
MNHASLRLALGTAVALIFSGAGMARASDNPFALKDRGRGYLRLAEAGSTREEPGAPKVIPAQLRDEPLVRNPRSLRAIVSYKH